MKNQVQEPVIGIPIDSAAYSTEKLLDNLLKDHNLELQCYNPSQNANFLLQQSPRISETLKGKLNLGVMILRTGGLTKVFNQKFSMRGEKLLKASQCYLSTTAGPIAGLLFISTDSRIAFCSESIFFNRRYVKNTLQGRDPTREDQVAST